MLSLDEIIRRNADTATYRPQQLSNNPRDTQTALARPHTGIAVREADGLPFLVYCDAVWVQDAKEQMDPIARAAGGHLVAALAGHHQARILTTWKPPPGL